MFRRFTLQTVLLLATAGIFATAGAQEEESEGWDVASIPGDARTIDIDTRSGTWMSLDVSPDGRTIAFDLLGDIYTVGIDGGEATNINSGLAWSMQPRFSPDGSEIASAHLSYLAAVSADAGYDFVRSVCARAAAYGLPALFISIPSTDDWDWTHYVDRQAVAPAPAQLYGIGLSNRSWLINTAEVSIRVFSNYEY